MLRNTRNIDSEELEIAISCKEMKGSEAVGAELLELGSCRF